MKIFIENLEFEAILGILEFEREKAQKIVVQCEIEYEQKYIDYSTIRTLIIDNMQKEKFLLIEDALVFLISDIKIVFPQAKEIKLKISKLDIFSDCIVGVEELVSY